MGKGRWGVASALFQRRLGVRGLAPAGRKSKRELKKAGPRVDVKDRSVAPLFSRRSTSS